MLVTAFSDCQPAEPYYTRFRLTSVPTNTHPKAIPPSPSQQQGSKGVTLTVVAVMVGWSALRANCPDNPPHPYPPTPPPSWVPLSVPRLSWSAMSAVGQQTPHPTPTHPDAYPPPFPRQTALTVNAFVVGHEGSCPTNTPPRPTDPQPQKSSPTHCRRCRGQP